MTKRPAIVNDVLKSDLESKNEAKIGPKIEPRPKAPVFIALIVFLEPSSLRMVAIAGTQLLLTNAPAIPPINIPTQIISILSGKSLIGPDPNIASTYMKVPCATSLLKFFYFSGIKLSAKLVRV